MYTNYKYAPTFDAETFCCCLCGMHAVAGPGSVAVYPGYLQWMAERKPNVWENSFETILKPFPSMN